MDWDMLYQEVARRCGATVEKVKEEMDEAIWTAYTAHDAPDCVVEAQQGVPCVGEVPTREELLIHLIGQVQNEDVYPIELP
ncbi:hypothetical protein ACH6CV_11105 [Bacillota bacterium Meth-B3]|nr:hypothetical protein [Christensenellaceae bacterium]MEA5066355.1 hypothetical protein [Eubacteriales bacterium]MEA5067735.1 hypothetical protein [Christensenellaceae bacterium]